MERFPYIVGHCDCSPPIAAFVSEEYASLFIGTVLHELDPKGVDAGEYYIDGPPQ